MDNKEKNDFNYVEQKIKSKSKKKIKKILIASGATLVAAVVFGFVARLIFVASEKSVNKLLGITPAPTQTIIQMVPDIRQEITFRDDTPAKVPSPTPLPVVTEEPQVTPEEQATPTPDEVSPVELPSPTPTPEPTATEAPEESSETVSEEPEKPEYTPLESYIMMLSEVRAVAVEAEKSVVRVYAVSTGINWMDERVENKKERTGIVVADNGVELLIVTDQAAVAGADRVEIEFRNGNTLPAIVFGLDADAGLAVVAVDLREIDEDTLNSYTYVKRGNSDDIFDGEPVIAIGRPNGYYGAVEFGFISHTGINSYFTDGEKKLFTTDIFSSEECDGLICDFEGQCVGMIFASETDSEHTLTAVNINSIKTVLLKLLNGRSINYFGIRAENLPKDALESMELENGIYVNEVIALSPAANAGIRKGEVITKINNTPIISVEQFYEYILNLDDNAVIDVDIYHGSMSEEPASTLSVEITSKN